MNYQIQDVCSILGVLVAIVGGIFALYQYKQSNKLIRVEKIQKVIEKLRAFKVEYLLEYDKKWYDMSFHGGDKEKELDEFLSCINFLCYLKRRKIITKKEFSLVDYEVRKVCCNEQVQFYLWNLYHFSKNNNTICTFNEIIEYGIKERLISEEFLTADTGRFGEKYLNF